MSIWLATYLIGWAATSGYGLGSCSGHAPCPAPIIVAGGAAWPVLLPMAIHADMKR